MIKKLYSINYILFKMCPKISGSAPSIFTYFGFITGQDDDIFLPDLHFVAMKKYNFFHQIEVGNFFFEKSLFSYLNLLGEIFKNRKLKVA
jgi:hypothetical protein